MFTKISSILAAALILGSASIASAATIHKPVRHHHNPAVTTLFYPQAQDVFRNF
jgi:hypothetical protein